MTDVAQAPDVVAFRTFRPEDQQACCDMLLEGFLSNAPNLFRQKVQNFLSLFLAVAAIPPAAAFSLLHDSNLPAAARLLLVVGSASTVPLLSLMFVYNSVYRKVGAALRGDVRDIMTFYKVADRSKGVDDEGSEGGSHFWVAEATSPSTGRQRIVGCVGLERVDAEVCELRRMCVCLTTRGARVGATLASNLIQHAKAHGFKKVVLSTASANFSALRLYSRLGWTLTKVEDEPVRRMHYMELDLHGVPLSCQT
ncbi:MAG: hypothetical protein WDW38_003085 [Sanguina aurantia]